jgi:putative tryptophan/tyrosine transport system substrate-binding protein
MRARFEQAQVAAPAVGLTVRSVEVRDTRELDAASSDFVDVGGLISYGPNIQDLFRRAATYVDKILRGAKPADLPVEQPTQFELVINIRAARALGIKFPNSILLRADKVID